jgi:hypothetical protein
VIDERTLFFRLIVLVVRFARRTHPVARRDVFHQELVGSAD